MTHELTFITSSLFDKAAFDNNADYWRFSFTDKIYASSSGFWRLLKSNKIIFVSFDNGEQFGLPEPIDLAVELNKILEGKYLTKIEVLKDTFDLVLTLTDDLKLEIFIASSGYETYDFSLNAKRYIGLGSGDIAIMNIS
ncbi:MAG: hypothetical protein WBP45_04545 [Daejeonella sp.]